MRQFHSCRLRQLTTSSRAAGAVAVTLPSCYFILSQDTGAHHGDDHGSHGEEHEEEESKEESSEEAESEEKPDEDGDKEEKTESTDESEKSDDSGKTEAAEKSDDSDSGDEKDADTPETSDDESDEPHKVGEDAKNVRKHVPDAKGGAKARLESKAAITQGKPAEEADGPSDKVTEYSPILPILLTTDSACCFQGGLWQQEHYERKARRAEQYRHEALN